MDELCFRLGAYCERSFKTTIQLTNHVNTHLGVKPFQVGIFREKRILLK